MKQQLEKLILIIPAGMAAFCVVGAFLGAEKVRAFFDSFPLWLWRYGGIVLLIWGILAARYLYTRPALFLIHLGCIFVLAGGITGKLSSFMPLYPVFAGYILLVCGLFGYFGMAIKKQVKKDPANKTGD